MHASHIVQTDQGHICIGFISSWSPPSSRGKQYLHSVHSLLDPCGGCATRSFISLDTVRNVWGHTSIQYLQPPHLSFCRTRLLLCTGELNSIGIMPHELNLSGVHISC